MSTSPLGRSDDDTVRTVWHSATSEIENHYCDVPFESPEKESPRIVSSALQRPVLEFDGARWMQNLPTDLRNRPLNTLTIPGSHNSGTFYLETELPISADKSPLFQTLANALPRSRIRSWAVCQQLTIYHQLQIGVRYLDFRIARTCGGDPFRIVHGLWGPSLHCILFQAKRFLDENPYEIVLLDLNHLYRIDTDDAFDELIELAFQVLGEQRIYRNASERLPGEVSLEWMAANGFRVILFAERDSERTNRVLPTRLAIDSPWANTANVRRLFQFLEKRHQRNEHRRGRFHVTQAILTPKLKTFVRRGAFGSLEKQLATRCTSEAIQWLQRNNRRLGGFNVVIADFVEKKDFCREIVALNYRNAGV